MSRPAPTSRLFVKLASSAHDDRMRSGQSHERGGRRLPSMPRSAEKPGGRSFSQARPSKMQGVTDVTDGRLLARSVSHRDGIRTPISVARSSASMTCRRARALVFLSIRKACRRSSISLPGCARSAWCPDPSAKPKRSAHRRPCSFSTDLGFQPRQQDACPCPGAHQLIRCADERRPG